MSAAEKREGALIALHAMSALEHQIEADNHNRQSGAVADTFENCCLHRQRAIDAVVLACPNVTPHVAGFIEALAAFLEFVYTSGTPNFEKWKPEVAMTPEELAEYEQSLRDSYAEGDSDPAAEISTAMASAPGLTASMNPSIVEAAPYPGPHHHSIGA